MKDNQVKILGGFLNQGELNYKEGVFKGYVVWPPELKKIRISFSEHYIERIELHEYMTNGARGKDACFSMMLTDGRELKLRATERTYQKICGKSRFSKKFPTVIISEPPDILSYMKWSGVAAVVLGGFYFCSADPTPEPSYSMPTATNGVSTTQNTAAKSVVSTDEACRFKDFDITSWKDSMGEGTYTCSSNPVDVSPDQMDGSIPNSITYAAQGSANSVAQVKIYLYVNDRSFGTASTNEFIEVCNSLSSKVTGKKLPKSMVSAIKNKQNKSQTINGFSVTIETENFVNAAKGYKQNCILSVAKPSTPSPIQPVVYSPQKLCKAALSVEFGRPVNIIKVSKTGTINELYYVRPADGSKWRYACKVEGGLIVWAAIDPDRVGSNERGRWRDDYASGDNRITYSVNSSTKQLTISAPQSGEQIFEPSDF